MIIQGEFNNITNDKRYKIVIGNSGTAYTVKDTTDVDYNALGICFSTEPVTISQDFTDTTKHVIETSATINLITNMDLSSLFIGSSNRDIPVTILYKYTSNNFWTTIFSGYVEPIEYNQPYAYKWTDISINCSDKLTISKYVNFYDITNILFPGQTTAFPYTSPQNILSAIAQEIGLTMEFAPGSNPHNYEVLPQYVRTALMSTKVNPYLFLGEDEDDYVNLEDVLEELGKYYGMYFRQSGTKLYVFDWHTSVRAYMSADPENFVGDDTQVSLSDVYKQVKLSCDADAQDELLNGLFDKDNLYSPYINYQKYMTEIISEGEGKRAFNGFWDLVEGNTPDWDGAYTYDHYMWIKQNDMWDFGSDSYIDYMEQHCKGQNDNYYNAHLVMHWLKEHPGKGMLVALGKTDKLSKTDNSPINSVSLTNYLMINVDGKCDCDNFLGYEDDMNDQLFDNQPVCQISSNSVNLTPSDVGTTNYIVISGKILLNPVQMITGKYRGSMFFWTDGKMDDTEVQSKYYAKYMNSTWTYQDALTQLSLHGRSDDYGWWHMTVPHQAHKDGVYYTHKFLQEINHDLKHPSYTTYGNVGMVPFLQNEKNRELEFKYSSNSRKKEDDISKLPIIACELKIGDKYCVERLDLEDGAGTFEWLTEEDCPEWEDQYTAASIKVEGKWKYFTLGIDPKIGDYIIGSQYDIQNNITVEMGIDAKGTAIPIHNSDNLSGDVSFKIMGPINLTYDDVKKSHHGWAFWKHTHWSEQDKFILQYISSIMIGDLKFKIESDNAMINNVTDDGDIVYASDTNEKYTDTLEDSVYICTALTAEEAAEMNLRERVSNSFVINASDNSNFYGFPIGEEDALVKPEEIYVRDYYNEYKEPRNIISTTIKLIDPELITDPQQVYFEFGFKGGEYAPIRYDANLYEDTFTFDAKDMQE